MIPAHPSPDRSGSSADFCVIKHHYFPGFCVIYLNSCVISGRVSTILRLIWNHVCWFHWHRHDSQLVRIPDLEWLHLKNLRPALRFLASSLHFGQVFVLMDLGIEVLLGRCFIILTSEYAAIHSSNHCHSNTHLKWPNLLCFLSCLALTSSSWG